MSKKSITKKIYEKCLLTEVSPYETPLLYSNWGAYNYYRTLINKNPPSELKEFLENDKPTIPYNYKYNKDLIKKRTLSLIHPGSSLKVINLYKHFDAMMVRLCQKSPYSIRFPHSVAKYFVYGKGRGESDKYIEQLDESKAYASSYFSYMHFSFLHKFFESDALTEIEKRFRFQKHLDITKCFPSIYTHSISWAIRGKLSAKKRSQKFQKKDRSLGAIFDELMQSINYNETNGIVVGPEMSRIFSEIIFQSIDMKIEKKMKDKDFNNGEHYHCSRYIDDFYLFYNDINVADSFTEVLASEIELYKLYINTEKIKSISRPFISSISIKKIAISKYINELAERIKSDESRERIDSQKEINRIREILQSSASDNNAITNFFLSAITNKIYILNKLNATESARLLKVFIDLAFYLIRIDTRVSSIFRITNFILEIIKITYNYPVFEKTSILDKLFYEISEALQIALINNANIEAMNLLIAAAELGNGHYLDTNFIDQIIKSCKRTIGWDEGDNKRLSYFEIVTLVYYFKEKPEYTNQRNEVLDESKKLLERFSLKDYSESAHLLLDLVSCPYISIDEKKLLVEVSFRNMGKEATSERVNRFINFVKKESWFFNWNASDDLKKLLKKKEYMLTY